MKSILFSVLFVSLMPLSSIAGEVVLSCKLKALPEMSNEGVNITGTFVVEKLSLTNLVMKVDAVVSQEGEEPEAIQFEDKVSSHEKRDETTIPTAEEYVASNMDLDAMREQLLDNQKMSSFEYFEGEGNQDDGSGLNLFRFVTVEGKSLNMINVGWSFLLCE